MLYCQTWCVCLHLCSVLASLANLPLRRENIRTPDGSLKAAVFFWHKLLHFMTVCWPGYCKKLFVKICILIAHHIIMIISDQQRQWQPGAAACVSQHVAQRFCDAAKGKSQITTWTMASLELCHPHSVPHINTHTHSCSQHCVSHQSTELPFVLFSFASLTGEMEEEAWLNLTQFITLRNERYCDKHIKKTTIFYWSFSFSLFSCSAWQYITYCAVNVHLSSG